MKKHYQQPLLQEVKIESKRVFCGSVISGGGDGNGRPASTPEQRDQSWIDFEN